MGIDVNDAGKMLRNLQEDIANGVMVMVPAEWADVHSIAEKLSAQHTSSYGHRALDILHVATALYLGAQEFLTFDIKQSRLAHEAGLEISLKI